MEKQRRKKYVQFWVICSIIEILLPQKCHVPLLLKFLCCFISIPIRLSLWMMNILTETNNKGSSKDIHPHHNHSLNKSDHLHAKKIWKEKYCWKNWMNQHPFDKCLKRMNDSMSFILQKNNIFGGVDGVDILCLVVQ